MNCPDTFYASAACMTRNICIDTNSACRYAPSMDFHKRLRRFRKDLDLSYQQIADVCGVKWQTVQQWCKDDGTYPKIENLEPLASLLKTTPWYLLWGVDSGGELSNTEGNTPLSDEANELIQCVIRIDGDSVPARKSFPLHTGLLTLAYEKHKSEDAQAGKRLLDQAEAEAQEELDHLSRDMTSGSRHAGTNKSRN